MDPVSAAGFASSIITFIDFSCKLVQGSVTLYQASAGATTENTRIGSVVDDLRNVTDALTSPPGSPQSGPHWQELRKIALECNDVSKDLADILDGLKRKEGNKAWRSLEAAWKNLRKSKEVATIEQRLSIYRVQLLLRLNLILSDDQASVKKQLDEIQKGDVNFFRQTFDELSSVHKAIGNLEARLMAEASQSLQISPDTSQEIRALDELRAELSVVVQALEAIPKRAPADLQVLNRLYFGTIHSRVDSVSDAEAGTFAWLLHDDTEICDNDNWLHGKDDDDASGSDDGDVMRRKTREAQQKVAGTFRTWLESGSGVFHISGKAGSGKSTLMKFLCNHEGLMEKLKSWAGHKKLVFANFFFWSSGDDQQRSLDGLYRSLLFEILHQCPDLTRIALPEFWTTAHASHTEGWAWARAPFRLIELREAMKNLTKSRPRFQDYQFCFFIDGLDEFEGDSTDHWELAQLLCQWADSLDVKICASSRPYQEFLDILDENQRIKLDELTSLDIHRFVRKTLTRGAPGHLDQAFLRESAQTIQYRSEGVFLWARLVVRSLLEGLRHRCSPATLRERIDQTPGDLEALFLRLFETIGPEDRYRSDQMLILASQNGPLNALMFSWLENLSDPGFPFNEPIRAYSKEEVLIRKEAVDSQVKLLCRGLLEVHAKVNNVANEAYFAYRVTFFHRTVRDFLRQPHVSSGIWQRLGNRFDANDAYLRLCLAEFKFGWPNSSSKSDSYFRLLSWSLERAMVTTAVKFPFEILESYAMIISDFRERRGEVLQWGHSLSIRSGYLSLKTTNEDVSFLHMLAWYGLYGLSDYVLDQVKKGQAGQQYHDTLSLLFTASTGTGGPDFLKRLMAAGVTLDDSVLVYGCLTSTSIPGWVAYLYTLASVVVARDYKPYSGNMWWAKLEILLATRPVLDIRWEYVPEDNSSHEFYDHGAEVVSTTLEEVILWLKPHNMDILMKEICRQKNWSGWNLTGILPSWMTQRVIGDQDGARGGVRGSLQSMRERQHVVKKIWLGKNCWEFTKHPYFRLY